MLHRLPARVSFAQGAAIGVPYATAYRALFQRAERASRAKPCSCTARPAASASPRVQLARAHGLTVIGSGGTDARPRSRRANTAPTSSSTTASRTIPTTIMQATDGRGVDVILEMAAHINLDKDLALLAQRGRVVVIGNRGRVEIDARQAMGRDAAILGMTLFNATPAELASIHAAIVAGLAERHAESGRRPRDAARATRRAPTKPSWSRARSARSFSPYELSAGAGLAYECETL